MRILALPLIACAASCGHAPAHHATVSSAASNSVDLAAPQDVEGPATESVPDVSALRLDIKQVASPTEVAFELRLTNGGPVPIKITTNPHFGHRTFAGHREGEFEIQLDDARGRSIPFQCIVDRLGTYQSDEALLQSAQTHVFTFSLDHGCYDLVPGEKLSFIATYASRFWGGAQGARGLPDVQPPDWVKVVVPDGWSNGGAAQLAP